MPVLVNLWIPINCIESLNITSVIPHHEFDIHPVCHEICIYLKDFEIYIDLDAMRFAYIWDVVGLLLNLRVMRCVPFWSTAKAIFIWDVMRFILIWMR